MNKEKLLGRRSSKINDKSMTGTTAQSRLSVSKIYAQVINLGLSLVLLLKHIF
jgi:hypothetical protein